MSMKKTSPSVRVEPNRETRRITGDNNMKNNQWKKDIKKKSQLIREKIREMERVSESMLLHEEYQNLDYRVRRLEMLLKK